MVRYIQITQVPPERLALWRSWLSPQRRKRAGRMLDDRETVCGEGLARELLAAALHCPPEEAPLRYDAQGKPLTDGLYLSISHSRRLAACAVADRPVGLDVELVRPAPRRVWEHLSPEERSHAANVFRDSGWRPTISAIAKIENILTERTTEGESPVKKAKAQDRKSTRLNSSHIL